jgi:NitT/TauT family transport system substrate-binding protein
VATLPIADTILLHEARDKGFFAKRGLDVELVPFQSAMEKDQAILAGGLDGHFCEMGSVIMQRSQGLPFRVVATTTHTGPGQRVFGLVTRPGSEARGLSGLRGATVGVSKPYMVDFMTGVFLEGAGLPGDFLERVDVRRIPIRYQMLVSGRLDLATFPEPLLSMAEGEGGRVLADDRGLDMPLAVVALRDGLPAWAVPAFRGALSDAVASVNAGPGAAVARMGELGLIPPALAGGYRPPAFDPGKIPSALPGRALFGRYVSWLEGCGALGGGLSGGPRPAPRYEDVVLQGGG